MLDSMLFEKGTWRKIYQKTKIWVGGQLNFYEGGSFSGQKDFKPEFSAKPILKQGQKFKFMFAFLYFQFSMLNCQTNKNKY